MTDPSAYAADPNHVPHPGRPPAERSSHGPSEVPDAQRPQKNQEPGEGDAAREQTTTMRTQEPASTHGPPHEERPVEGRSTSTEPSSADEQAAADERPVDGPSTATEPASADEQAAADERMAPDEAVADTRPSGRDVTALNEPTAAVGERRPAPPAEAVDPDPRHRGDVGDERGPGVY